MDVTMINEDADQKAMLSRRMIDRATIDDAVNISVLTSLEEAHTDGEPDLVIELIDLYLDDVPQKLKAMREALTARDSHSLRNAAHSLKGSSSVLGAYQMAALCDDIEASANDLSSQEVDSFLTGVEQEFERVRLIFAAERRRRLS